MNRAKVDDEAYINFLMATPKVCSATEAARVRPEAVDPPAHDAFFTRLLHRQEPDAATRWREAAPQVERQGGVLVVDDSVMDAASCRKALFLIVGIVAWITSNKFGTWGGRG